MADNEQVLVPIEQETIIFQDRPIVAVRLADGRIAAVLRWLCEGLQLAPDPQVRRIRRTEAIAGDLLMVRVQTEGGQQTMPALTLRALPFWLAGLSVKHVSEELRPVILAYQLEAVDVLYRHFSQPRPPATVVPAEPIQKPTRPPEGSDPLTMAQYHRDMAAWLEWQADIEQWRGAIEDRLESVEEVARLVPEILDRLGPQTLTPEHQGTLKAMVKRLHEVSGLAYPTINYDLTQAFHVGKTEQLLEAQWSQIVRWLQARIDAAERRKRP